MTKIIKAGDLKITTGKMQRIDQAIALIGNPALLDISLLAVFGSTSCPARYLLQAHELAHEWRHGKTGIISGFHAPAEKEVLAVLLKGTCPIIVVLGRSLENARILAAWKEEIESGRMLVISPFKKYQKYVTKEISMKRNDLAARIAGRVMIIHASEGGSLQGQVGKWKSEGIQVEYLDKI
ncbi:MAG: DNA-processing protein DprA [Chloroflexota bacterium]